MHHHSYERLLHALSPQQRQGPIVLILIQDDLELAQTVAHFRAARVACIIGVGPAQSSPAGLDHSAPFDCHRAGAMAVAANALMARVPGAWVLPCWNGDRTYWPHADSRPLSDLFAFLGDERREVFGGVVLDTYPGPGDCWHLDRIGYVRTGDAIRGGLRDRIGPPCPAAGMRLDRPLAVKARKGLRLRADGMTTDPALNTLHGRWHHSPTGARVSPRVWAWVAAQADHDSRTLPLHWPGSMRFGGTASDLWDMGFLEPGQWV